MENQVKKREWVKNAAIILLAALLVLTFFSNTIMNRNLPEVATQAVMDGNITAKVRGTGTVTANGSHMVKAEKISEIRAVMVKAGQEVNAGDVLFILGSGESSELEEAQERLEQLQLSYQRTALGGSSTDYTADEARLQAAKDAYDRAYAAYQALLDDDGKPHDDDDGYLFLQKELEKATIERDAAKEALDSTLAEAQAELSSAESERLSAEQAVLLAEGWTLSELTDEQRAYLNDPQSRIDELRSGSSGLQIPNTEEGDGSEGEEGLDEDTDSDPTPVPPQDDTALLLEKWETLLEKKNSVKAAQDALNAVSSAQLDAAQAKVDGILDEMSKYEVSPEFQNAWEKMNEAKLNYLDLQAALDARKNAEARANAGLGLDLRDLDRQIREQKEKIAELSGGEENQVLAKVSGKVESVECTAGDTVPKDGVLCVLEVPDMGYSLSFSVTNDQAARLRVGDSATVSNYYWGTRIEATLESIRVDPKNPQTNKLLTFSVSGDVNAGAELTISVGQRSANYDTVIPKSAVRNDANGYFVLKVESKSSPLGNRYIARRVPVEILAQDDTSAAVTGELGWGDYVITTSSAPLKNGDLVRLTD